MTKRPLAIALTLAIGLVLAACSKTEAPAAGGEAHEAAHKHIGAYDGDGARGALIAVDKTLSTTGQACVDCHGAGGAKPIDATYPVLAGQYQDYLFHTIQQYRDGGRDHALMSVQIKGAAEAGKLDDQGIADLAAYFASQAGPLGDLHNR
ncbi:MAG: c-type cytochrome [Lysobacter sp.]|nr:c-type cytochrome [Lysobacter sp.]